MASPTLVLSDAADARMAPRSVGVAERLGLTVEGLRVELIGSWIHTADVGSFIRFVADALGYRLQRLVSFGDGRRREIKFKDGSVVSYRLNRGDVRVIAEIWMSEAYVLPFEIQVRNLIDLGANIGLASLWLGRRYGCSRVVAIEPVPDNAELARLNLERNGIDADVLQAAIGPTEGTARFELSSTSTLGRVGDGGIDVPVITAQSVIDRFPVEERIDLLKIDVEGAEQGLFQGDLEWLERVDCVVMELHGDRVDYKGIIDAMRSRGFAFYEIGQSSKYGAPTDITGAFRRLSIEAIRPTGD